MLTETVANIITRARQRADAETTTPTLDFSTDAEALNYLNESGKRLWDLILSNGGSDLLARPATLTAPTYTLPADFYKGLAVETHVDGRWIPLRHVPFLERNNEIHDPRLPGYRLGQSLWLFPENHTAGDLRLWYVPHWSVAVLTGGPPLTMFGGWDDYLVFDVAMGIVAKEERDVSFLLNMRNDAEARIRASVAQLKLADTDRVADVMPYPEYAYDWYHGGRSG